MATKAAPRRIGSAARKIAPAVESQEIETLDGEVVDDDTVLSNMLDDLSKPIEVDPIKLVVPGRPAFHVLYNPVIDYEDFQAWQKRAVDRKSKEKEVDPLKLAITTLSNLGIGLVYKGQERFDSHGEPLSLSNNELHKWLKVPVGDTRGAIRRLYGADGHILITMMRLFKEAGFDPDMEVDEADDPL